MANDAYLRLKGQKSGDIKGPVTRTGRKDAIRVIAFSHDVISPRDAASGLPTGKRQHKPIIITKEIDRTSPLLMNMLVTNENITQWELSFWQRNANGKEGPYFTIRLTNASIAGIRQEKINDQQPDGVQMKEREHISFCYQKIEWIYVDGGVTAEDDWESPVV